MCDNNLQLLSKESLHSPIQRGEGNNVNFSLYSKFASGSASREPERLSRRAT